VHLKHGTCMLIHFIHGYYCIYRPWQPLRYLYFPYHCISLIYFNITKIRRFLYAQINRLAEFGDVSCLQFNYLRVETLTPTWEDLVGYLSDNFKGEVRQNSVSDLSVWSLIHLEGSVVVNPTTIRSRPRLSLPTTYIIKYTIEHYNME
jgi:hypothetical protein